MTDVQTKTIGSRSAKKRGSRRVPKSKKQRKKDIRPVAKPDIPALARVSTEAEKLDLMAHKAQAPSVPESEIERIGAAATKALLNFGLVARQERSARHYRAKSCAVALPLVQELCDRPQIVWAIAERKKLKITERTVKSPCLAAVKVLFPELDRREHSDVAQIHNHALANGWGADDLQREIEAVGTVEIVRRERQRQRLRAGQPAAPGPEEIVAAYRDQATASRPRDVCPPKEKPALGLALALCEFVDGEMVVYDIDTDEKRVLAAVKICAKHGRELRVRSADNGLAEAAE